MYLQAPKLNFVIAAKQVNNAQREADSKGRIQSRVASRVVRDLILSLDDTDGNSSVIGVRHTCTLLERNVPTDNLGSG